jgi:hypothetical protein
MNGDWPIRDQTDDANDRRKTFDQAGERELFTDKISDNALEARAPPPGSTITFTSSIAFFGLSILLIVPGRSLISPLTLPAACSRLRRHNRLRCLALRFPVDAKPMSWPRRRYKAQSRRSA